MIKRILLKAGVLIPIFVISLILFHRMMEAADDVATLQMETPTYPTMSFQLGEDLIVNQTYGFSSEMDIGSMRDTVTSTEGLHTLTAYIQPFENKIEAASYEVVSVTGDAVLESGLLELGEEGENGIPLKFEFGDAWFNVEEGILKITVESAEKGPLYFYTRLTKKSGEDTANCVKFARDLSEMTRDYANADDVEAYLDITTDADNGTFRHVTSHCNVDQVMLRGVNKSDYSDYRIRLHETNETYTSLTFSYTMKAGGEDYMDTYDVTEFWRIRSGKFHYYLLDFERTMEVQYQTKSNYVTKKGLDLGITATDVDHQIAGDDGSMAFVQNDTLWYYDIHDNQLTRVFGYRRAENADLRDQITQYKIRTISMDEKGNVCFLVSGYMNADTYEGQVGTMICFYDVNERTVTTAAFVPSNKSAEVTIGELPDFAYYSHDHHRLYMEINGDIYEVNVNNGEKSILAENLRDGDYTASANGRYLAYCKEPAVSRDITVVDLETGDEWPNKIPNDGSLQLLGFIGGDLVYGLGSEADAGLDMMGEEFRPMNRVKIVDAELNELKNYESGDRYVGGAVVNDSLVELEMYAKSGEIFTKSGLDHITLQENEDLNAPVALEHYMNDPMMRSMRFAVSQNIHGKTSRRTAELLKTSSGAPQLTFDSEEKDAYYVYAHGSVHGVYDRAGDAVASADQELGTASSHTGGVIWIRGNRDLNYRIPYFYDYSTDGTDAYYGTLAAAAQIAADYMQVDLDAQNALRNTGIKAALQEAALRSGAETLDLSGASLDEMKHIINHNTPIIALEDATHALVLVGYTDETFIYVDPEDGEVKEMGSGEASERFAPSGNAFIALYRSNYAGR